MAELKPCPFCGGDARPKIMSSLNLETYIFCLDCGATAKKFNGADYPPGYSVAEIEKEAIAAWNKRSEG